ncbi:MAG: type IV toxin-antitoxin system AbiEi family antitoxin domain-containing protein, partial [Anaerolineales bacterium]
MTENAIDRATKIFKDHNGILRTQQAIKLGIAPRTLYKMRDDGIILRESRGLYRLADVEPGSYTDLVQVALSVPKGVICLISALAFHDLTTQIPHRVYIALPLHAEKPRLDSHVQTNFIAKFKAISDGLLYGVNINRDTVQIVALNAGGISFF